MDHYFYNDEEDRLEKGGLTESDNAFLKEYNATLPKEDPGEPLTLYLHDAVKIAVRRKKKGTPLADLVAEANLGLTEALSLGASNREAVLRAVETQIDLFYEEQAVTEEADGKLAAHVAMLSETIDRWIADYGEKPTIDELANAIGTSQDRILDILKLSGDDPKDEP